MEISSGILIIYKEMGYTSFDVVAKLRRILHIKKIGHTGTLDPNAEGVLCVCIGKATKLVEQLMEHNKEYEATLLLGRTTDTQDTSGTVLSEHKVNPTAAKRLDAVVAEFIGDIEQVPPMYSAKKLNGKRLYEAARRGETVERKAVRIHIDSIGITEVSLPRVKLRIACSKGTYIRTLCNDIGERLGCGGCMETLLRTRVGEYSLSEAIKLDEVERLYNAGRLAERIITIEEIFSALPMYVCRMEAGQRLFNGNALLAGDVLPEDMTAASDKLLYGDYGDDSMNIGDGASGRIRVKAPDGRFAGVYERTGDGCYRVDKFFLQ